MADPFHAVDVLESWDETPTLRALVLDLDALGASHSSPGQCVKARTPGGEGYFALANAPGANGRAEILVRRGHPVADALVAAAESGARVEVSAPFGRGFPLAEASGRDLLLFATGSGISPIRAVLQQIVRARGGYRRVALFYGERADGDFAYLKEHASWSEVEIVLCASKPSASWSGARGYVQEVARARAFAGVAAASAVAFLCGMKPMVAAVREALSAYGVSVERTFLNF